MNKFEMLWCVSVSAMLIGCSTPPYYHRVNSLEDVREYSSSMPIVVDDKVVSMEYDEERNLYYVTHKVLVSTPIGQGESSYVACAANKEKLFCIDSGRQYESINKIINRFSCMDYERFVEAYYLKTFRYPTCVADEERIVAWMLKTDDVAVWCEGVELVSDDRLLADVAIAAHAFGEYDGKVLNSVLPAGLRAVEKLNKKAYIEKVYERALSNEVREAAKSKR